MRVRVRVEVGGKRVGIRTPEHEPVFVRHEI